MGLDWGGPWASYKIQDLSRVYSCPNFVPSLSNQLWEGEGLFVTLEELQTFVQTLSLSRVCPMSVQWAIGGWWALGQN